jgi:hypothetical protein
MLQQGSINHLLVGKVWFHIIVGQQITTTTVTGGRQPQGLKGLTIAVRDMHKPHCIIFQRQ